MRFSRSKAKLALALVAAVLGLSGCVAYPAEGYYPYAGGPYYYGPPVSGTVIIGGGRYYHHPHWHWR